MDALAELTRWHEVFDLSVAYTTAAVDDVLDRIGAVAGVERTTSAIVLSTKLDR